MTEEPFDLGARGAGMLGVDGWQTEPVVMGDGVTLCTMAVGPVDAPGLLMVHGIGGSAADFADHLARFAVDHRVVVFDLRGHGASARPQQPAAYSLDRLAADAFTVARSHGLRDVRVLGHSMGGMVARRLVLAHPEYVSAVVFMDTSPGPPPAVSPELAALAAGIALTEGMEALQRAQDELDPLGSAPFRRTMATRKGFREYRAWKWACADAVAWATLAVEVTTQPDQLDELATLTVPTLVIVGEEDAAFVSASRAMAATIPGAELFVVPDAGHSPQFEQPDIWYDAVRDFLDRC